MIDAKELLKTLHEVKSIYLEKGNDETYRDLKKTWISISDGVDLSIKMVESQCRLNGVEYEEKYMIEDVFLDEGQLV